jgi:hypothetical protein
MPRKEDLAKYLAIHQKSSINYFNHPFYVFGYTLKTNYTKKRAIFTVFSFPHVCLPTENLQNQFFFWRNFRLSKKILFLHMVQKVGRQK